MTTYSTNEVRKRRRRVRSSTTCTNSMYLRNLILIYIGMVVYLIGTTGGYETCNFCRSPNIVTKPTGIVSNLFILQLIGINTTLSCNQLNLMATMGLFPDQICLVLQSRASLRRNCGCIQPEFLPTPPVPPTTSAPVPVPPSTLVPTTFQPQLLSDSNPSSFPSRQPVTSNPIVLALPTSKPRRTSKPTNNKNIENNTNKKPTTTTATKIMDMGMGRRRTVRQR